MSCVYEMNMFTITSFFYITVGVRIVRVKTSVKDLTIRSGVRVVNLHKVASQLMLYACLFIKKKKKKIINYPPE